jgi:hypothetical protein
MRKKKKDQGRREGGSREGKVPCALNQEFLFLVHEYLGSQRPISFEVSAPTRLSLRGSHVQRKFRDYLTQRKQYLKRTTLRRLKIPLRSIRSEEGRTIALERNVSKKAVKDKRQSTFFSRVGYPL